jgi:hypothetical protein
MLDDLAFDARALRPGAALGLPPEAPLAMPKQVIEWDRVRRTRRTGGWLRRLLRAAR